MNVLNDEQRQTLLDTFSSDKEKINTYIGNVSPQLMEKLKKLSPIALVSFLE
jgi:hypothetical protein